MALFRFLGSFGLAVGVLLAMLGLTFIGTMAQRTVDPYTVQTEYFESWILWQDLFGKLPFPLPGGLLLLSILFVNLVIGGMIRMRMRVRNVGVLIIHLGIATLLIGNLVEYLRSTKGHMAVFEGESSDEFESYYDWEVAVLEPAGDGGERAHIIPGDRFDGLGPSEEAVFRSDALPFDVRLSGFVPHGRPTMRDLPGGETRAGFKAQTPPKETERSLAGLSIEVEGKSTVLWGASNIPWVVEIGEKPYGFLLRKRSYQLPFTVELKDFQHEYHPGVAMPKRYSSDVVRHEGSISEDVHIAMNEPMRSHGYIFYQSSWGQAREGPRPRVLGLLGGLQPGRPGAADRGAHRLARVAGASDLETGHLHRRAEVGGSPCGIRRSCSWRFSSRSRAARGIPEFTDDTLEFVGALPIQSEGRGQAAVDVRRLFVAAHQPQAVVRGRQRTQVEAGRLVPEGHAIPAGVAAGPHLS